MHVQHRSIISALDESTQVDVVGGQRVHRYAVDRSQGELQPLTRARLVIERLAARFARLSRGDRVDVTLRGAHVPPATPAHMRMGRATDAEVVALPPVEEVVPALASRSCEVRYLVPLESFGCEPFAGKDVLRRLVVVSG